MLNDDDKVLNATDSTDDTANTDDTPETLETLLGARADFLLVDVRPSLSQPGGFDVVLRLDGTYFVESWAHDAAEYCRARLLAVLPPEWHRRMVSWNRPMEKTPDEEDADVDDAAS